MCGRRHRQVSRSTLCTLSVGAGSALPNLCCPAPPALPRPTCAAPPRPAIPRRPSPSSRASRALARAPWPRSQRCGAAWAAYRFLSFFLACFARLPGLGGCLGWEAGCACLAGLGGVHGGWSGGWAAGRLPSWPVPGRCGRCACRVISHAVGCLDCGCGVQPADASCWCQGPHQPRRPPLPAPTSPCATSPHRSSLRPAPWQLLKRLALAG